MVLWYFDFYFMMAMRFRNFDFNLFLVSSWNFNLNFNFHLFLFMMVLVLVIRLSKLFVKVFIFLMMFSLKLLELQPSQILKINVYIKVISVFKIILRSMMASKVMLRPKSWQILVSLAHQVYDDEPQTAEEQSQLYTAHYDCVQSELVIHLELQYALLFLQQTEVVVLPVVDFLLDSVHHLPANPFTHKQLISNCKQTYLLPILLFRGWRPSVLLCLAPSTLECDLKDKLALNLICSSGFWSISKCVWFLLKAWSLGTI